MQYIHSFLIGALIGTVGWLHFADHKTRQRLNTLETTTTADWYSNAQDDAERSERLEMLEALKSSAIHYGDAAVIRVVQGDVVTFGRWSEPKEGAAK